MQQHKQIPRDIGPILCEVIDNNPSKRKTLATVTTGESGGQVFIKQREMDKKCANQYHWEGFSNSGHFSLQNCFDPILSVERCEDNVQALSSLGEKRESENNQPELDLSKKTSHTAFAYFRLMM